MFPIIIPGLTGQFANWRYYQLIIPVSTLTQKIDDYYFIKTVDEVKEIFSKNLNDWLQRQLDYKRLQPIINYLTNQDDKYINNLTIAIYGGDPEWLAIDLSPLSNEDNLKKLKETDDDKWQKINSYFGLIKLTGNEILFVLDGQHRVKGLRQAIAEDKSLLNQEISITLISHNTSAEGRTRTRRLFTTINRYAKPVSFGETILLDEDDLAAIVTRELIQFYPLFKDTNVIALSKTANLMPSDTEKFSTAICLYNITEIFIDEKKVYPVFKGPRRNLIKVRPNEETIKTAIEDIFKSWDIFFDLYPKAKDFISGDISYKEKIKTENLFFLRPIGQEVIFRVIRELIRLHKDSLIFKLSQIEGKLESNFWNYIMWDPNRNKILNNKEKSVDYLLYHLGILNDTKRLKKLQEFYLKNSARTKEKLPAQLLV